MERFGEVIAQHLEGRTVFYVELVGRNPISDKEVKNVDVACSFAAQFRPILFKFNSALVVLIDNVVVDCFVLGFKEIPSPDDL